MSEKQTLAEQVLGQITSGRWLLTLAIGIVFVFASLQGILPPDDIKMIIGMGMTFYFMKSRNGEINGHGSPFGANDLNIFMDSHEKLMNQLSEKNDEVNTLKRIVSRRP